MIVHILHECADVDDVQQRRQINDSLSHNLVLMKYLYMFSSLKLFYNLVSEQAERRIRAIARRGEREKHMAPMMLLSERRKNPARNYGMHKT